MPEFYGGEPMTQWFVCDHLPARLRTVAAPFLLLARDVVDVLPRNPERTVCLRKLLEAKDCAVRAALYQEPQARDSGGAAVLVAEPGDDGLPGRPLEPVS